ncbi:MAG: hypothetical protein ACJ72C_00550, partial [Nitrososphaeraceae archaeon]
VSSSIFFEYGNIESRHPLSSLVDSFRYSIFPLHSAAFFAPLSYAYAYALRKISQIISMNIHQ